MSYYNDDENYNANHHDNKDHDDNANNNDTNDHFDNGLGDVRGTDKNVIDVRSSVDCSIIVDSNEKLAQVV